MSREVESTQPQVTDTERVRNRRARRDDGVEVVSNGITHDRHYIDRGTGEDVIRRGKLLRETTRAGTVLRDGSWTPRDSIVNFRSISTKL